MSLASHLARGGRAALLWLRFPPQVTRGSMFRCGMRRRGHWNDLLSARQTWDGWLPMVQLLQEVAPADVGIIRLVLEGRLPVPAVAAFLVEPDGYFIASVQETLLDIFAGPEAAAQLPSCANTFRLAPVLQLEPNPDPDTAPEPERGDGRGARGGARHHVELADAALQRGLRALNDVDLAATLRVRTPTFQSVPGWMRGLLAFALRSGLRLIRDAPGTAAAREAVGWKLFLLAARMLSRPLPPTELERRAGIVQGGRVGPAAAAGAGPPPPDSLEARGERAAHLGELSAAARALTAELLAPGNEET